MVPANFVSLVGEVSIHSADEDAAFQVKYVEWGSGH